MGGEGGEICFDDKVKVVFTGLTAPVLTVNG